MIRTHLWYITLMLDDYVPGAKAKRGKMNSKEFFVECEDTQGKNHQISIHLSDCNTGRYLYMFDNGSYIKSERIG